MPNVHSPNDARDPPHTAYRRAKDEAVDNMDFVMFTSNRRSEVLSDGLGAIFDRGRLQNGIKDHAHRIRKSGGSIGHAGPEVS